MEKFLIINPYGIGDVLFTTPVLSALKKHYPKSFIGYWCNERVFGLLKSSPLIDKIFPLSRGDLKRAHKGLKGFAALFNLIMKIRKEKFDVVFDFSLDSRYGLLSKVAGIKKRIGFDFKNRGLFLTHKKELDGYSGRHVVEYYADLLKYVGIELKEKSLSMAVSDNSRMRANARLRQLGIHDSDLLIGIAMGGGASWGADASYKQWPVKKFSELAGRLNKDTDSYIFLLGSSDEKELADIIAKDCDNNKIINMAGALDLEELAALIQKLNILICNDGGPLHMAVALNVNTIAMYGPVDDVVYGPYPPSSRHIVVNVDLSCRPCYKNFRFLGCCNNRRCLEDITVDEVYEKVKSLL